MEFSSRSHAHIDDIFNEIESSTQDDLPKNFLNINEIENELSNKLENLSSIKKSCLIFVNFFNILFDFLILFFDGISIDSIALSSLFVSHNLFSIERISDPSSQAENNRSFFYNNNEYNINYIHLLKNLRLYRRFFLLFFCFFPNYLPLIILSMDNLLKLHNSLGTFGSLISIKFILTFFVVLIHFPFFFITYVFFFFILLSRTCLILTLLHTVLVIFLSKNIQKTNKDIINDTENLFSCINLISNNNSSYRKGGILSPKVINGIKSR